MERDSTPQYVVRTHLYFSMTYDLDDAEETGPSWAHKFGALATRRIRPARGCRTISTSSGSVDRVYRRKCSSFSSRHSQAKS